MREYIQSFCKEYDFPEEANELLMDVWDKLCVNSEGDSIFQSIEQFHRDEDQDYTNVFLGLK